MKQLWLALTLVTAFVGSAAAAPMNADEIKASMIGKKLNWKSKDGKFKGNNFYAADGTATVTGNFKATQKDTGRWTANGTNFCTTWSVLRGGKEACGNWTKVSATTFIDEEGTTATIAK